MQQCPEVDDALVQLADCSDSRRAAAVERVVDNLLSAFAELPLRSTDGVAMLREEITPERYYAVATVWMMPDQRVEPICIDLLFTPAREVASARVLFGLAGRRLPRGVNSVDKLETMLEAYPHELPPTMEWAVTLKRDAEGWRNSTAKSGRAG